MEAAVMPNLYPFVQHCNELVAPFATEHMYAVRRMHHHHLVAVFYVCPIPSQAAIIKQTIMAKEERDAPKAQVQSYFVFGLHLGDRV